MTDGEYVTEVSVDGDTWTEVEPNVVVDLTGWPHARIRRVDP